jgi:DNA-binding IclR family transcriptional regulator
VEIRSVTKAIRLLEALSKEPGSYGVSELARQIDIDKSSASRMLRTLEQAGFVAQDPDTQRYTLGVALIALGQRALRRLNVRDAARSAVEALVAATAECAHVAILVGGRVLYLDQAAPERGVNVEAPVGTLVPLHCTALGKALLAFQDDASYGALRAMIDFEVFTRRTITDATALDSHLAQVRRAGVAYDDEEFSVGVRCIAAPVFRHDGAVCAAIGISGPSPRMTDDNLRKAEAIVREQAAAVSRRLGYVPTMDTVPDNSIEKKKVAAARP